MRIVPSRNGAVIVEQALRLPSYYPTWAGRPGPPAPPGAAPGLSKRTA
jgi:hypothetical protein